MKVKDLNFGYSGIYRSKYFVNGFWFDIEVSKRNFRSFYLYVKREDYILPMVNCPISANFELDSFSPDFSLFYYGN